MRMGDVEEGEGDGGNGGGGGGNERTDDVRQELDNLEKERRRVLQEHNERNDVYEDAFQDTVHGMSEFEVVKDIIYCGVELHAILFFLLVFLQVFLLIFKVSGISDASWGAWLVPAWVLDAVTLVFWLRWCKEALFGKARVIVTQTQLTTGKVKHVAERINKVSLRLQYHPITLLSMIVTWAAWLVFKILFVIHFDSDGRHIGTFFMMLPLMIWSGIMFWIMVVSAHLTMSGDPRRGMLLYNVLPAKLSDWLIQMRVFHRPESTPDDLRSNTCLYVMSRFVERVKDQMPEDTEVPGDLNVFIPDGAHTGNGAL